MENKKKVKVETITETKNQRQLDETCAKEECTENKLSDFHKDGEKNSEKVAGGDFGG